MSRSSRGFTLIEVMVALTIVAITLGAGVRAAGALTGNSERLLDMSAAQWCADNRLSGLRLGKIFPDVGDSDFSCDELGRTYSGKQIVRPTPNPNFRRVDTQMLNDHGDPILTISTVMGRY